MLFEWECAYFMSSAITTPTTVSTTTAVAAMVAASSNTTAAQGDASEVTVPAILLSNDHTPMSNGTSNEVVEYEQQQHQQVQESPQITEALQDQSPSDGNTQQQKEQQSPQLTEVPQEQLLVESNNQQQQEQQKEQQLSPQQEQQQNSQLAEVPPDPTQGDSKSLQKEQHHEQHQKQKEPQLSQIELIRKKRLKLKPWFKQISAEEISTDKKNQTESDSIPEPPRSISAPEATGTAKSKSKKVSLKSRKASLSAIVFKQLMKAGGQGIGVGINKDLPPAARQRPPVRRVPAVPPPAAGVEVGSAKKSSSKTLSSESSGDPIPEHFGSTIEES